MTHSFTVFRPLNDGNMWNNKLNSDKSRPKSLDMAKEYSTFSGTRSQMKQVSGFLPSLSVFILRSKSNLMANHPQDSVLPVRNVNGLSVRPFTWGPNGSKFTDAIASLVHIDLSPTANRENELITSPRIIDDVSNNNNFLRKRKKTLSSESGSTCTSTNTSSSGKELDDKEEKMVLDSSTMDIPSQNSTELCRPVASPASPADTVISHSLQEEQVDKMVEDLVSEMINEVVRNEAFLKSQALFKANEMKLAHSFRLKNEVQRYQKQSQVFVQENNNTDMPNATNHCETSLENTCDITPNMDEAEIELRRRTACDFPEKDIAAAVVGPPHLISQDAALLNAVNNVLIRSVSTEEPTSVLQENLLESCLQSTECNLCTDISEPHQQDEFSNEDSSYSNESSLKNDNVVNFDQLELPCKYDETITNDASFAIEPVSVVMIDQIKEDSVVITEKNKEDSFAMTEHTEKEEAFMTEPNLSTASNTASTEFAMSLTHFEDAKAITEFCVQELLVEVEARVKQGSSSTHNNQTTEMSVMESIQDNPLQQLLEQMNETDLHLVPTPVWSQSSESVSDSCSENSNDQFSEDTLFDCTNSLAPAEGLSYDEFDTTLTADSFEDESSSEDSLGEETLVKPLFDTDDSSNDADNEDASDTEAVSANKSVSSFGDINNNNDTSASKDVSDNEDSNHGTNNPFPPSHTNNHSHESKNDVVVNTVHFTLSSQVEKDSPTTVFPHQNVVIDNTPDVALRETSFMPDSSESVLIDAEAMSENMFSLIENNLQQSPTENNSSETSQMLVDNVIDSALLVEKKMKPNSPRITDPITDINSDMIQCEILSVECPSPLSPALYNTECPSNMTTDSSDSLITDTARTESAQSNPLPSKSDIKVCHKSDDYTTPKRPTSLFLRNPASGNKSEKVFGLLKQIGSSNLTPAQEDDKLADVYSEATEKVLEENKSLSRQESFTKPYAPVRYRPKIRPTNLQKQVHLEESDPESDIDIENRLENANKKSFLEDRKDVSSDTELLFLSTDSNAPASGPTCHCFDKRPPSFVMQSRRSRSLPFNINPDYCDIINFSPLDLSFDDDLRLEPNMTTPTVAHPYSYFLNVQESRSKRDSALSRESAASSGTVVASEEDDFESHEAREAVNHLTRNSKYSSSTKSPLTTQDAVDTTKVLRRFKMERSQSLDRQQNRNSRRFARYSPISVVHQANCGMMLSAPSITVTHDCTSVHHNGSQFDPMMSSQQSLASTTSYMGDESDALRSSSIGSSPLSSPSNSPNLRRKGQTKPRSKSKILTHRSTKHAERQASEACEWLKAAGFPQYVQLYEDGNFPVDIASVSSDHDFLGQEHIAALVRRLNILNKCANLKLDKTSSKDGLTDNDEEEELEQYALSDFWRFEENHHRWSRLDSKASSVGSPTTRSTNSVQKSIEGLNEESNGDVFAKDDTLRAIHNDNSGSEDKLSQTSIDQPRLVPNKQVTLKPKSHSFLKRVQKIGSFRRKDQPQRPTVVDIPLDESWNRPVAKSRHKSLRKSRNVTISKPVLQGGHEKFEHMKCTTIDISPSGVKELQNQHRGRKPSSHSLMSSSSSSGGASTISTPASRRTRASTEDFSSDFGGEMSPGFNNRSRIAELNTALRLKEHAQDRENSTFVIPRDYKPGTFPAALREKSDDEPTPPTTAPVRSHSVSDSMQSAPENARNTSRPMSVYDNLPETAISGNVTAQDIIKILDPGSTLIGGTDSDMYMGSMESLEINGTGIDPAFWSVDDIVEHTQNLQQMVGTWGEEEFDDEDDRINSIDSTLDAPFAPPEVLPSYNADSISNLDDDSDTTSLTSSEQRNQLLLRWEPLKRENSDCSTTSDNLQLHTLSACQLMMLRRLSMLKLTARMEQYALSNNKGTLSWSVPRFIRRMKIPDYKDKTVFGVPLLQNVQRFGQPLPICIQHALACLRRTALDQVGLFRKPGVKGRILKLRELCDLNPELEVFEDCSAYDIADLIKQYFRALPDPLMTMKMSETFVGIFLYVPENLWLQTLQTAILLLPDENRESLKTLLHFLADVASNREENHMNAINLSTCFAPSLFYQQLVNTRLMASTVSPKIKKTHGGRSLAISGKPDMKAMSENKASNQCLAFMINNVNDLFKISEDATTQCRMSVMQQAEDVLAAEIGYKNDHQDEKDYYADFHAYVDRVIRDTMREEQRYNQNRGWQNVPTTTGCELACKKMNDGNPLRMWRGQVEVSGADPGQIMDRILNEQHLWDPELLQWKVLQQPDERSQLFQVVRSEMSPQPSRDYCVLRSWRKNVTPRDTHAIVEVSTGPHPLLGDVRGVVLTSRYVIDPTDVPNKCVLTHMCRVDTKGRNPEWYNKAYGHIVSQNLLRIKESIKNLPPKMTSLIA